MKTTLRVISIIGSIVVTGIAAAQSISYETYKLVLSSNTEGTLAVAGAASAPAVAGAASGDTILRAETRNILFSANAGADPQFVLTPGGFFGLGFKGAAGTPAPQKLLHLVGPEGRVPSFPSAALGTRDLLVLENNSNSNISLIAAGAGYQHAIRFVKSGDSAATGVLGYMHGDNFMYFSAGSAERMRIDGTGKVGFGVTAPISALHQYTNTSGNPTTAAITNSATKDGLLTLNSGALAAAGGGGGILFGGYLSSQFFGAIKSLLTDSSGNTTGDLAFSTRGSTADSSLTERVRITATGTVAIGTTSPNTQYKLHVNGSGRFEGALTGASVAAHYQDLAEWVPATDSLPAGTVVVIDRSSPNTVTASNAAYDTAVAGVISSEPGIILGVEAPNKLRVATTGRVKVRAYGPVAIGDLLVTSGTAGVAMRSEPMSVNGRTFHQPGTLIGKALEPLEKGAGEILVLLSLQ